MIFFFSFLAFFFVPIQIAIAQPVVVAAVHHGPHLLMRKPLNVHRIVHAKPVNKDAKAINQFLHEVATVAAVLYPDFAKSMGYSMISSVLFGDQTQSKEVKNDSKTNSLSSERPAAEWINEIAKIKKAIEKEKDTQWANLLGKLRQIMDKAMRAFEESENGEQSGKKRKIGEENAKIEELRTEIIKAIVELAALDNILEKEIMEPLGKEMGQKRMLKELAQLWNQLKLEFEQKEDQKFNEKSKNEERKRTKRMLQLIMHFPIEAVGELANSKRVKKNSSRRHRRHKHFGPFGIASVCLIGLTLLAFGTTGIYYFFKKYSAKNAAKTAVQTPAAHQSSGEVMSTMEQGRQHEETMG